MLTGMSGSALAADLREPAGGPAYVDERARNRPVRPGYGEIWDDEFGRGSAGRGGIGRRVMGGPDYVGSQYGLGKPNYMGIGPRPDWGRSSTD